MKLHEAIEKAREDCFIRNRVTSEEYFYTYCLITAAGSMKLIKFWSQEKFVDFLEGLKAGEWEGDSFDCEVTFNVDEVMSDQWEVCS